MNEKSSDQLRMEQATAFRGWEALAGAAAVAGLSLAARQLHERKHAALTLAQILGNTAINDAKKQGISRVVALLLAEGRVTSERLRHHYEKSSVQDLGDSIMRAFDMTAEAAPVVVGVSISALSKEHKKRQAAAKWAFSYLRDHKLIESKKGDAGSYAFELSPGLRVLDEDEVTVRVPDGFESDFPTIVRELQYLGHDIAGGALIQSSAIAQSGPELTVLPNQDGFLSVVSKSNREV